VQIEASQEGVYHSFLRRGPVRFEQRPSARR
jgi:hypothetical protein